MLKGNFIALVKIMLSVTEIFIKGINWFNNFCSWFSRTFQVSYITFIFAIT